MSSALTTHLDVAQVVLYAFWFFFAGLIIYLRREDKREGYPLESDRAGGVSVVGFPPPPAPKEFLLPHGGGVRYAPRKEAPLGELAATPVAPWPGAPLQPTGNPMLDGVGPAACPKRANDPDLTIDGHPRIVPMRVATEFFVEPRDPDPRGMQVVGADGEVGGTVTDIWVDRGEPQIRYLEVNVGARNVLLPINFARVKGGQVKVVSILGGQFADAPGLSNPDQVTLREEDRVCAYYAGGHLYAKPLRTESIL